MDFYLVVDFDGVISKPKENFNIPSGLYSSAYDIIKYCPENIKALQKLIDTTRAKIIVSSSHRIDRSIEHLENSLRLAGLKGFEIVGKTTDKVLRFSAEENRREQILSHFCDIKQSIWVALDDWNLGIPEPYFVKINPSKGITDDDVDKVIKFFDEQVNTYNAKNKIGGSNNVE